MLNSYSIGKERKKEKKGKKTLQSMCLIAPYSMAQRTCNVMHTYQT